MTSSHQSIMKCPWQWRQPFLDEKRESRKRKAGDGYFYDPVDPSFVDHLLPGYAKKFCASDLLESDEKEKIEREIQRLMMKKEETAVVFDLEDDSSDASDDVMNMINQENMALVDSILQMTKSVEESSSSLLMSPISVSSSQSSDDEDDCESGREDGVSINLTSRFESASHYEVRSPSTLELVSDNLQDNYFASEDSDILDFPTVLTDPMDDSPSSP